MKLLDADHQLVEGAGWFEVKDFAIRIHATSDGVSVEVYVTGSEDGPTIAGCYAFDSQCEEYKRAAPEKTPQRSA